jgi:hypothetical protein
MNGMVDPTLPDLEQLRRAADPLADDTIARLLDRWDDVAPEDACAHHCNFEILGVVTRQMQQWQTNGALGQWKASGVDPAVAAELEAFVAAGLVLPAWHDKEKITRAEELFYDFGMLSCTLLFCSSLPECYVIPDLAAVLHVAGQLEDRTEYRIRSTAAMIFPVMMIGGLTEPEGGGVAQILKVRLIHATIRHLILRGNPSQVGQRDLVPPLSSIERCNLHHALFGLGWNIADDGVPCSQDELAYTLLTFGYVFLRSLRKLGLGLPQGDEEAYLHTWNVMGHVLGMQTTLMAHTMDDAALLFARLQARGRTQTYHPDPRPGLGQALMNTMKAVLPFAILKPFPALLTRHLCGKTTATDIGIVEQVPLYSRLLFVACMLVARAVDWTVRLVFKQFSICRMLTRVVGYQFTVKVLMDQARPLKLPEALHQQMAAMTSGWHLDPKAPRWMNAIEHRLTKRKPEQEHKRPDEGDQA